MEVGIQCFELHKTWIHFEPKSQYFIVKMDNFELESQCFVTQKGDHFQTGKQRCVPLTRSKGAGIKI